ncbi:MAG: Fic family protein [Chloroflexi bacterium]|nr:Fic family protein [Chloroflexota bacterium]
MATRKKSVYTKGAPGLGVRRRWAGGQLSLSGGRLARDGFVYHAFDGWPIRDIAKTLPADLAQDLAAAESEIRRLNDDPPRTQLLEAVARQLLRAEAVASSGIEGLELPHRNLARAAFDPEAATVNARSVLGNVRAMDEAIRLGSADRGLSVADISRIHRRLFEGTRDAAIGGVIRDRQNWIGGRDNPWGAAFIPVPEGQVTGLLKDLCTFAARDDLSPVTQAAIVHAQFETIHPFEDGNGRVGRALIHLILRRRGIAPFYVPPISLVLAANYREYERGLTAFREKEIEEWCGLFARAVTISCRGAAELAGRIEDLKRRWREKAGSLRAGSAAAKLIDLLPVQPVIDLRTVESSLGISDEAARLGIARLEEAGVLTELTKRKRGRAWECVGLFALLDSFERIVATADGAHDSGRRVPRETATSRGR